MIQQHEIPTGSNLYVGSCAKQKREFENKAAKILENHQFVEIVTPYFSYHQSEFVKEELLIKVADNNNKTFSLRSDSSIDVVRLATKRLEKIHNLFYIQPVFKYPSSEFYQVGAESIGETPLETMIELSSEILYTQKDNAILQISNIQIPKILARVFNLDISVFKNAKLDSLFSINKDWLNELVYVSSLQDLENLVAKYSDIDKEILKEINKLIDITKKITYKNIKITPIYFSELLFYKNLYFRFFERNKTYGLGGIYEIEKQICTGFSLYTDRILGK